MGGCCSSTSSDAQDQVGEREGLLNHHGGISSATSAAPYSSASISVSRSSPGVRSSNRKGSSRSSASSPSIAGAATGSPSRRRSGNGNGNLAFGVVGTGASSLEATAGSLASAGTDEYLGGNSANSQRVRRVPQKAGAAQNATPNARSKASLGRRRRGGGGFTDKDSTSSEASSGAARFRGTRSNSDANVRTDSDSEILVSTLTMQPGTSVDQQMESHHVPASSYQDRGFRSGTRAGASQQRISRRDAVSRQPGPSSRSSPSPAGTRPRSNSNGLTSFTPKTASTTRGSQAASPHTSRFRVVRGTLAGTGRLSTSPGGASPQCASSLLLSLAAVEARFTNQLIRVPRIFLLQASPPPPPVLASPVRGPWRPGPSAFDPFRMPSREYSDSSSRSSSSDHSGEHAMAPVNSSVNFRDRFSDVKLGSGAYGKVVLALERLLAPPISDTASKASNNSISSPSDTDHGVPLVLAACCGLPHVGLVPALQLLRASDSSILPRAADQSAVPGPNFSRGSADITVHRAPSSGAMVFDSDEESDTGSVLSSMGDAQAPAPSDVCTCSVFRVVALKICDKAMLRRRRRGGAFATAAMLGGSNPDTAELVAAATAAAAAGTPFEGALPGSSFSSTSSCSSLPRSASATVLSSASSVQQRTALDDVFAEIVVMEYLQQSQVQLLLDKPESLVNIRRLLTVVDDPTLDKLFLSFEYSDLGSLDRYVPPLESLSDSWEWPYFGAAAVSDRPFGPARTILRGLLSALEYCHSIGVVHCDVKPDNVLLFSDSPREALASVRELSDVLRTGRTHPLWPNFPERFTVKLADFGQAIVLGQKFNMSSSSKESDARFASTSRGTVALNVPPELTFASVKGIIPSAVDVWGVGVTMYWTLVGRPPFWPDGATSVAGTLMMMTMYDLVANADCVSPLREQSSWTECPEAMSSLELLDTMLKKDARERASFRQITDHPFLQRA